MVHTALITGASKRIGKAIAEHLSEKGWNLAIHYNHSGKAAEKLVKQLSEKFPGNKFQVFQADLGNLNEVMKLIPVVCSEMGIIDLLINNASVFEKGYLIETSPELYQRQLDVNLRAPFFLIKDFAKHCKKGGIINFVDTRITSSKSNFSAYSISKKGLWELTKIAALEFAPDIRVNAIAPGVSLAPADENEDYLWKLAENIPMKRPGGIDPIIKSVDYIIENNHLTGQLLFADGGENLGKNV